MALIGAFSSLFTEMMMPLSCIPAMCWICPLMPQVNIQFGADSDTGLANLAVMVGITGIDGSTAGAYLCMEFFGKLEQHVKTFLASHAVAAGNHDGSRLSGSVFANGRLASDISMIAFICYLF